MNHHQYFDHDADIGIIGQGDSVTACFINVAQAMFALMTDLTQVQSKITCQIEFTEEDIELALVIWLNLLLAKAQAGNLVFCQFHLQRFGPVWQGMALGEKWRDDLERRIEVKGATLTQLSVKKQAKQWEATCIVDV